MAGIDRSPPAPDDVVRCEEILAAIDRSGTPGGLGLTLADGTSVQLPDPVVDALRDVLEAFARGLTVRVVPQHTVLTTQQGADLLGVSRPTFVKLLEDGHVPFTQPGRHRRVLLSDVLAHRERVRRERGQALDDLAAVSKDAGLYADDVSGARLRR